MNKRKAFRSILCVVVSLSIFTQVAFAATTNIGSTTHEYDSIEPAHFRLQADVTYSELHDNVMTITSMQSRVWNYSDSAVYMTAPTFIAGTGTIHHSTNSVQSYNAVQIPIGTSNYYTNVNWQTFLDTYYGGASSTYTIPRSASDSSAVFLTTIGIFADSYHNNGVAYSYGAYWHGDGYIEILDCVANTPYWRYKNVSTVNPASSTYSVASINSLEDRHSSIVAELCTDTNNLSFTITVDDHMSGHFATTPVVATDPAFENILDVNEDDILIFDGNSLQFSVQCDELCDVIYIKMPDITQIDRDTERVLDDISDLQVCEIFDEENNIRLVELSYSGDDFSIIPNSATLSAESDIECIMSTVYFDDNNDVLGGTFVFGVPENFTMKSDYSLLLQGELTSVEGTVYELKID